MLGAYVVVQFYPFGVKILFSFVLNTLSYIREGTVRYLWLRGERRGGGGVKFSKSVEMGGSFFKCSRILGRYPFLK